MDVIVSVVTFIVDECFIINNTVKKETSIL